MVFGKTLILALLTPVLLSAQDPQGDIPLSDPPPLPDQVETQVEAESVDPNSETVPLIRKKREVAPSMYRQEQRFIEHPNASKGLIRIEKDKTYIYRVPESEKKAAASVRVGMYSPENLVNPDNSSLSFDTIYTESSYPMFLYDYERPIFKTAIGHLNWKVGMGFYFAQGQGQFATGATAEEKFTLLVFPLSAGLIYRMQYWDTQAVVPYGCGGVDGFAFAERRDDSLNPSLGARLGIAPAAHFCGGVGVRLGRGARAFVDLDREYGINSLWVTAEYRSYVAITDTFDFSSEFIGGGIFAEY